MKKILSLLAVAAMAFTACTTDITEDVNVNTGAEYGVPLEFAVEQGETRAFMDDDVNIQFEEGDEIGVYVTPADANAEATVNAKFTISLKNGILTAGGQVASFTAGDTVMAYYPYYEGNEGKAATEIVLQLNEIQVQPATDRASLKNMPMVSVKTTLESATGGSLLFRPVASIMKLNIYSIDEAKQNLTIRRVRFYAQKHEDVTGCNYLAGNYTGFDLTTVTEDSEIKIDNAKISKSRGSEDSYIDYACMAIADYKEVGAAVGTSTLDAASVYLVLFPGSYGGKFITGDSYSKIEIHTEEMGRFDINVTSNHEFGRAMIRPFSINLEQYTPKATINVEYIAKHAVDYAKIEDGSVTGGMGADQFFDEELIVIGSGAENVNMARAGYNSWGSQYFADNQRTFYAQTLDGTQGYRFEYLTAGRNTLKRGDKIKLYSGKMRWFKRAVADGEWEYFATGVSESNIYKLTSGCENEIVTKEKHINELTAADLNTDIKLLDMEFVLKDAPYVHGYSDHATTGVVGQVRDQSATMMQDKHDDAIFILINSKCTWKRNLTEKIKVPQGKGSVHGVLVHTTDKSYANNGNIGKFQLRPYDNTSFEMTATKESAVNEVVSWRLDQSTYSLSQYAWNGSTTTGNFTSTSQPAGGQTNQNKMVGIVNGAWDANTALYATNRYVIASANVIKTEYPNFVLSCGEINSSTNYKMYTNNSWHPNAADGMTNTGEHAFSLTREPDYMCGANCRSLLFNHDVASYYGWGEDGEWDGTTTGIVAEFPGADKDMSISFNIGNLCPGKTKNNAYEMKHRWRGLTYGFPLYWKVECSIDDGKTWTRCTNAINGEDLFKMNPTMRWTKNTEITSPMDGTTKVTVNTPDDHCHQYLQQKFVLPTTAIGAAKVMVKISPANLRLAWFGKTSDEAAYTDTSDVEGFDCTKDYKYIHALFLEDVVVTTAAE